MYDLKDELKIDVGEKQFFYKGLGGWPCEDLEQVIKKDGLNKMIVPFEFDSKEIINDFMSDKTADKRKEYIQNNDFSIVKV